MNEPFRWGVLGTGFIAGKFAAELSQTSLCELAAVGSRTDEAARRFAERFGGAHHGDYEALLADDRVEAVYNALPNHLHHLWTVKALEAGKHVLCEKPLARNTVEAERMFQAAERCGRLLVEAFMYRAHPAIDRLIAAVREGAIGRPRLLRTHFSFCRPASAADARYHADWGGGSIMDVGCYCVHFARAVLGAEPIGARALIHRHELGVDDYAAGTLRFPDDALCVFTCGMTVFGEWTSYVCGTEGWIEIEEPWFGGIGGFTLVRGQNEQRRAIEVRAPRGLYAMEAERFAAAARGEAEPWISREDTLGNMRVLDVLRRSADLPV